MENPWLEIYNYATQLGIYELLGLIFGLLNVVFLIRQSIYTWLTGILYVLVSFVVFWQIQLYGDLLLHIVFLVLNIYGWWFWINGRQSTDSELPVTNLSGFLQIKIIFFNLIGIGLFGFFLSNIHLIWSQIEPASVPYWDATTSVLSITGIWLMAKKKIENWHYWLAVDILATFIYIFKEIYFYAFLYGIYIIMAVVGYNTWKKTLNLSK